MSCHSERSEESLSPSDKSFLLRVSQFSLVPRQNDRTMIIAFTSQIYLHKNSENQRMIIGTIRMMFALLHAIGAIEILSLRI
jgi:hypothetical protein